MPLVLQPEVAAEAGKRCSQAWLNLTNYHKHETIRNFGKTQTTNQHA